MGTKKITVRQVAELKGVSERMIYMAKELQKTGRSDLVDECKAGRVTPLGALKIAKPEKYSSKKTDGLAALARAWCAATPEDREAFLETIGCGDCKIADESAWRGGGAHE